ncbi:MAG TPA: protease modulator HflK [Gemmatimonadaceae bacterium]
MPFHDAAATPVGEPNDEQPPAGRYRGVIGALLAAATLGALGTVVGGRAFSNTVLLDVALSFTIAAGILVGVLIADMRRHRSIEVPEIAQKQETAAATLTDGASEPTASTESAAAPADEHAKVATELFPDAGSKATRRTNWIPSLSETAASIERRIAKMDTLDRIRAATGIAGLVAAAVILGIESFPAALGLSATIASAVAYIAAAVLAAGVARYFRDVKSDELPEAAGLTQAARVLAWILLIAAVAIAAQWANLSSILTALHLVVLGIDVAVCLALLAPKTTTPDGVHFPVALGPLTMLGARANVLAGILDAAERQLGIDLRSTWAITVVRRSLEPLALSLVLVGWLSTSFTVVGLDEQGITERLGVPVGGDLPPGLHLHWPFPIDRVYRIPVQRAQSITVGHEGEEAPGPENVLWSVKHAENEFTLVLGNGRDLITVDAAVHFRVTNPRAWQYRSQNPTDALKALAYRAVMRNTVNRTLTEALSENVTVLTQRMREMVQRDADSLGLGVSIIGFTVGGMHPPVAVAPAYEGVVSAEIRKATAVVDAQVFRNQALPGAEAAAVVATNGARAEAAEALGRAAGEAWSFRALESQYRASPADYLFRRRLETMEKGLANRPFTVVDARFLRDGGELWVVP